MTSLNPSLRLALIKKAKSKKNILQKGFTLVELMVVVAIVGILSGVALPSFLNQQTKAKATECGQKAGNIMSQVAAEAIMDKTQAHELGIELVKTENDNSANCTFTWDTTTKLDTDADTETGRMDVIGKGELAGKYDANTCVNVGTNQRDFTVSYTGTAPDDDCG